jgi:hypothetical protein
MKTFTINNNTQYANVSTMRQLINLNKNNGYHFFDKGSMKWFNSRIHSDVYGGCVFVTSERRGWDRPREYTVRIVHANGSIETCSSFGQYSSRYQAHEAAKHLIQHGYLTVI